MLSDELFQQDQALERLVERYLRKEIRCRPGGRTRRAVKPELCAVTEWGDRCFTLRLPTGLLLEYEPVESETVFTPLDRVFVEACASFFGPVLYLYQRAGNDFRGLTQLSSSLDHYLNPDAHVLQRYLSRAIGPRGPFVTLIDTLDFIHLVVETMQARIEGHGVVSGLAFFPNVESFRQGCDGLSLLAESQTLKRFRDLKPYLPLADGEEIFILVVGNRIHGVGRIPELRALEGTRFRFRNDLPGNPLLAKFAGAGNCEILGSHQDRLTALLSYLNGQPLIRDEDAVAAELKKRLCRFLPELNPEKVDRFAALLMQLPARGKGATVLVGESFPELVRVFETETRSLDAQLLGKDRVVPGLQELLIRHTFTDGAVLFDRQLRLKGFGAILPVHAASTQPSMGARHTSAASYTHAFPHVGAVVVSQDGPVSVYVAGERVLVV